MTLARTDAGLERLHEPVALHMVIYMQKEPRLLLTQLGLWTVVRGISEPART